MWQPGMTLADVEKEVIISALRFYRDNKTQTAAALGITAKTIHNKLKEYGLDGSEEPRKSNWGRVEEGLLPTQGGVRVESPPEVSEKQTVPSVRKREKVQELPSTNHASGHSTGTAE